MDHTHRLFLPGLTAAMMLVCATTGSASAQVAPQGIRLTPLQQQQLSRDLVPSDTQNFFSVGQAKLEQEIRFLTWPRSPLDENLLTVRQGVQPPPDERLEQHRSLQHDQSK